MNQFPGSRLCGLVWLHSLEKYRHSQAGVSDSIRQAYLFFSLWSLVIQSNHADIRDFSHRGLINQLMSLDSLFVFPVAWQRHLCSRTARVCGSGPNLSFIFWSFTACQLCHLLKKGKKKSCVCLAQRMHMQTKVVAALWVCVCVPGHEAERHFLNISNRSAVMHVLLMTFCTGSGN